MSIYKNKNIVISLVLASCLFSLSAQTYLSSPYSRFGIGDISRRSSATNISMGGVGYAYQDATTVNFLNPASYIAFDSLSALIDAAFSYKYHQLQQGSNKPQSGGTIMFDYLSLGFSITKWWKTSAGFQTFSLINYDINTPMPYNSGDSSFTSNAKFNGTGGLYEVYWGNAFRLFNNFSLGFNVSYLFGTSDKMRKMEFDEDYFLNFKVDNEMTVKGALFSFGAQYFIPVRKSKIGLGLVYTPSIPTIFGKQREYTYVYTGTGLSETNIDTLSWKEGDNEEKRVKITFPTTIGAGVSWQYEDKYFVGLDFSWSNWSTFAIDGKKDSLADSYRIALGGSITPNSSSSRYFSRMTFRLGAKYEQTYVMVKETQIETFGINFGLSFPIKRSKTSLNVNFEYGQYGTTAKDLLKEDYFILMFNVKLHERWYQRRKYD